ncbi:MAG: 2-amino-4-hydroxy-6-hydroxymethyldihydropteridine diphosphokinase [Treponemataceae bacterium]|nr:2-amino-4-hydroxy-6-hydroxymethyldihydropteridine diphosphokinase [Treponemataceae bacterium]
MVPVLLGLGSNAEFQGRSPLALLASACARLESLLCGAEFSSVYESRAMYVTEQRSFYNMAARGLVPDSMEPHALLRALHEIERAHGRERSREVRNGPRPLDIDIEEFGTVELADAELTLPHPRMHERQFVLIPALEIFQKYADCLEGKALASYARRLPDQGVVRCSEEIQREFARMKAFGSDAPV